MNVFEETGVKVGFFVAGCLGALSSFLKPQKLSRWQRALTFFSGGFSAMYLTPILIMPLEAVHEIGYSGELGAAYLVGYSGLKSIELAIVQIKKRFKVKE